MDHGRLRWAILKNGATTIPPYMAVVELSMVVLMGSPSWFTISTPDTFLVIWTRQKWVKSFFQKSKITLILLSTSSIAAGISSALGGGGPLDFSLDPSMFPEDVDNDDPYHCHPFHCHSHSHCYHWSFEGVTHLKPSLTIPYLYIRLKENTVMTLYCPFLRKSSKLLSPDDDFSLVCPSWKLIQTGVV